MTKKFMVEVVRVVEVSLDETKFTEEFMNEYRESFDDSFYDLSDHVKQLGWLLAAGRISGYEKEFIEGYGPANEMGIKISEVYGDEIEIIREIA